MLESLDILAIATLFKEKGALAYVGEEVNQLEHALQAASLAEAEGGTPALVAAALLHDLGHMLSDLRGTPTERGLDDRHEHRALPLLGARWGEALLAPIRGHVEAKRFLCATEPGYERVLSPDSRRSLVLQGGAMSPSERAAFLDMPHAGDAVRLRRWDDRAKVAGRETPPLDHFLAVVRACARG